MKIGTKIRLIRQHRHMTQRELGERIGLGASGANRIAQYEIGYRTHDLFTDRQPDGIVNLLSAANRGQPNRDSNASACLRTSVAPRFCFCGCKTAQPNFHCF